MLCKITDQIFIFSRGILECNFKIIDGKIIFYYKEFFNKNLDFVIDKNKVLKIGLSHEFLGENQEVYSAGTLVVNSYGYIVEITNTSGHYKPNLENLLYTYDLLENFLNLSFSKIKAVNNTFNTDFFYLDIKQELIEYKSSPFDLNFETTQPEFVVEIPNIFNWEVYCSENNLQHLKTEKECQEHYKFFGIYSRNIINYNYKHIEKLVKILGAKKIFLFYDKPVNFEIIEEKTDLEKEIYYCTFSFLEKDQPKIKKSGCKIKWKTDVQKMNFNK